MSEFTCASRLQRHTVALTATFLLQLMRFICSWYTVIRVPVSHTFPLVPVFDGSYAQECAEDLTLP